MISICVPTFRDSHILSYALESVIDQDADFELIIVENYDSLITEDASKKIKNLRERYLDDKRVKWYKNESYLPIQQNWNKAVSLSTRDHVKLMGADDRLQVGAISKIINMISAHPAVDLHGHLAHVIDFRGEFIKKQRPYSGSDQPILISKIAALKGKLRQTVRFKEPVCNVFKRAAWDKVGGYSNKYRFCFDVEFNTKIMSYGSCALWNIYLVDIRRHSRSDGATLPASLALHDLQGLTDDILCRIGSNASSEDFAAARGWIIYRFLELTSQRLLFRPDDAWRTFVDNYRILLQTPSSYKYASKLLMNRLFHGDVQGAYESPIC